METALRLAPGRSLAYYSIAMTLVQKGDPQAALAAIQKEPGGLWRLVGVAGINHPLRREGGPAAALARTVKKYAKETASNIPAMYALPRAANPASHVIHE